MWHCTWIQRWCNCNCECIGSNVSWGNKASLIQWYNAGRISYISFRWCQYSSKLANNRRILSCHTICNCHCLSRSSGNGNNSIHSWKTSDSYRGSRTWVFKYNLKVCCCCLRVNFSWNYIRICAILWKCCSINLQISTCWA